MYNNEPLNLRLLTTFSNIPYKGCSMFKCKQCTLSNLNVSIKVNLKYKKAKKTRNVIIL